MPAINLPTSVLLNNTKRLFLIGTAAIFFSNPAIAQKNIDILEEAVTEAEMPSETNAPDSDSKYAPGEVAPHSECLADKKNSPEECAERQRANAEQLAIAEEQMRANEASAKLYQDRLAAYNAQMEVYHNTIKSSGAAQSSYSDTKARYDQARAQWEADVAACNAGDTTRCSKTPPPPPQ